MPRNIIKHSFEGKIRKIVKRNNMKKERVGEITDNPCTELL
jgi:hypothetical protein